MDGDAHMATVTISEAGQIGLPEDVLEESDLAPGSEVIVLKSKGRITLVSRERFEQLAEQPLQKWMAELERSLAEHPNEPFFAGLSFEEYAALSDEEDKALWDRLWKEAEREAKLVERDVPPHYRPAGQK